MAWITNSAALAWALLALSLATLPAPRAVASSRLRRLSTQAVRSGYDDRLVAGPGLASGTGPARCAADPDSSGAGDSVRRRARLFAALAGAAVLVTFPSVGGGLAAVTATAGTYFLLRETAPSAWVGRRRGSGLAAIRWPAGLVRRAVEGDPTLAFAMGLLAVCLRAGMPTSAALRSVASTLSDVQHPVRAAGATAKVPGVALVLARAAAASELGSEPATAWQDWIGHPVYGPLARALVVTGESGSAVASRLDTVAQQVRAAAAQQAMTRAQRAGVALMAPLGLCFLPAFVCLGVLPVVVGIAGRVFG